jgi:hypothetical protein
MTTNNKKTRNALDKTVHLRTCLKTFGTPGMHPWTWRWIAT